MDKKFYKQAWFWIIIVAVIIAGGLLIFREEVFEEDEVALRVGEEEIMMSDFERSVEQVKNEYEMYGLPADEEEILDQAIDRSIQEALLMQYADEEGIEATEEEVEQEYEEAMQMSGLQSEEEFLAQMEAQGIDQDEIDDLLEMEVRIQKLLDYYGEEVDLEEGEVQEAYEDYEDQMGEMYPGEEVPGFEEMEGDLEEELVQEQATPLLLETIEELREETEIEILVNEEDIEIELETEQPMMEPDMEETPEIEMEPEEGDMEIDDEDFEEELEDLEEELQETE